MRSFLNPAFRILLASALLALLHVASLADTMQGRVVGITDGDTLTVLAAGRQHKVRLAGIDAPEKRQPFGEAARQGLAAVAFDKPVVILFHKSDRYGRLVGKVLVDGTDAGLVLLQKGLAWHYVAYAREQDARDRHAYADAERNARLGGRGLWVQQKPVPPWEVRVERSQH